MGELYLEGEVKGDGEFWKQKEYTLNGWIHEYRYPLALIFYSLVLLTLSFLAFTVLNYSRSLNKDPRLMVYLSLTALVGIPLGGFLIMIIAVDIAFVGGILSDRNSKILLGPAGEGMKCMTDRERALRSLLVLGSIYGILFMLFGFLWILDVIFSINGTLHSLLLASGWTILSAAIVLLFHWKLKTVKGTGPSDAQRVYLNHLMPELDTSEVRYMIQFLVTMFVGFLLSYLMISWILSMRVFGLRYDTSTFLSFSISLFIVIYALIRLALVEGEKKWRRKRAFWNAYGDRPEVWDHMMIVKWYGVRRYLKLMTVPSKWNVHDTIYCERIIRNWPSMMVKMVDNMNRSGDWQKLYYSLRVPERYSVSHSIREGYHDR